MSDVNNIYAGPGIFIWGIEADGTEETDAITIDLTQGGITFTTTTTYFEPATDQTGTAPVKSISTGTTGAINFETPDMDFEKVILYNPNADKIVDGTTPTKVKYQVTGLAGKELPRKRAVIKPQGVDDPKRFIYIESVGIKFDMNAAFVLDNNLRLTVSAMAYPALDATPKGLLYTWGDITATA
ncbi:hypothetical protein SAMN04487895_104220 [Paenibacillus sophorae]|uniref:Phage major tail protein, phi13 family n=1 Tax=Paenibacillus sophorae TaxID=1333845 RepID=A0A1H8L8V1_9BACL|nr:hypothetical protein [Paenibacillus sophorae]QWU17394.1 hypothetical protein KP014_09695 [Paenibacillus sophorae]SEO01226.1 hypothetical protein SAMN04487895_104220 [Paenibacillus sophorae]